MSPESNRVGIPAGTRAVVRVPATSANLGPGFDSCGLALAWYDEVAATVTEGPTTVAVSGEGSDHVPRDEDHLVVATLRRGLAELAAEAPGIALQAHNTIPHGGGLGSSAAAIVAGLALAWGLARPGEPLDRQWVLQVSSELEGHPDNAAAAVLGGYVIAWEESGQRYRGVSLSVAPSVAVVAFVSDEAVPTHHARGILPAEVPHVDAARTAGRAALLTHALSAAPELLLPATEEWLHQNARASRMPSAFDLMTRLREAGHAAVISGAGPTVLVLGERDRMAGLLERSESRFRPRMLEVGHGVELVGTSPGSAAETRPDGPNVR